MTMMTNATGTSQEKRRRHVLLWSFGLIAAVALPLGGLAGWHAASPIPLLTNNPWLALVAIAITLAAILPLSLWYWRAIDELARAAHLNAWMWGGGNGLLAGYLGAAFSSALPPAWLSALTDAPAHEVLYRGALAPLLGAMIGYGVVWTWYWLRQR